MSTSWSHLWPLNTWLIFSTSCNYQILQAYREMPKCTASKGPCDIFKYIVVHIHQYNLQKHSNHCSKGLIKAPNPDWILTNPDLLKSWKIFCIFAEVPRLYPYQLHGKCPSTEFDLLAFKASQKFNYSSGFNHFIPLWKPKPMTRCNNYISPAGGSVGLCLTKPHYTCVLMSGWMQFFP